jgi:hypothetical protein
METYKNESVTTDQHLFELQIDQQSISYLGETAKWAKFLSIVGFILCGFMLIAAIFAGTVLATLSQMGGGYSAGTFMNGFGGILAFVYIVLALLYFFPCLYLFKFSGKMQFALRNNDQTTLNTSFGHLKSCFKFVGILTIVFLGIYLLVFIGGIMAAAFMR